MNLFTVFGVAVALGTDAFSLAVGLGMIGIRWRRALAFALVVCLFHIFMPLTGLLLGQYLGYLLGRLAGVLGAVVLLGLGGQLLWHGVRSRVTSGPTLRTVASREPVLPANPLGTLGLAGSVSLDALTVGFGLGALRVDLWATVLIMGLIAGSMTWTGFLCGRHLGRWAGERARLLGGVLLLFIAVRLFMEVW